MKDILQRLTELCNKEMIKYDITIKDYAYRCGLSYTLMRRICNGKATDLMLSTIDRICCNSHFSFDDLICKNEDNIEKIFQRFKVYIDDDRYSISVKKFR